MRPLFELEANKNRYGELGLDGFDLFRLTSAVLDVIITEMGGFQRGATYDQVMRLLDAETRKLDPTIDAVRVDRITSFLLDALTNERARDAFRLEFQYEAQGGRLVWSPLVFKLVELRDLDGSGEGRYIASAEAINIYLSSLGVELEGQQAADEAALRHFILHGKLDEAELAARTALMRTIEYADRIRRALQLVERNVSEIDWVTEMLPKMDAARNHIEERMKAEESLIVEAERKMEDADLHGKQKLFVVKEQLDAASRQHNGLLNLVLSANRRFMDEHARQGFRPVSLNPFPNPQTAAVRPLLRLGMGEANQWLTRHWFLLHPPQLRSLPDFSLMTKVLLQRKRVFEPAGEVVSETEMEDTGDTEPAFAPEVWTEFQNVFSRMPEQFRLSSCLDEFSPTNEAAKHLTVLRIAQWFEGRAEDPDVQPISGPFVNDGFYGDDVLVTKRT